MGIKSLFVFLFFVSQAIFLPTLLLQQAVLADEFNWTGGGGDNAWQNPLNWVNVTSGGGGDADGVPDDNDAAQFPIDASTSGGGALGIEISPSVRLIVEPGVISIGKQGSSSSITNHGEIKFLGATSGSDEFLTIAGDVSLVGSGEITLIESNDSRIFGSGDSTLTNFDNTIRGAGNIEVKTINMATIRAEFGRLRIETLFDNSMGDIQIASNGVLRGDGPIVGGYITGEQGATIEGTFRDVTFGGALKLGFTTLFANTITNNGTIAFSGFEGTSDEFLSIVGEVNLDGTGEIVLVEKDDSIIFGGSDALLINKGNTIRGLGYVEVDVINKGRIRPEGGRLGFADAVDNSAGHVEIASDGILVGSATPGQAISGGLITAETGARIGGGFSNVSINGNVKLSFNNLFNDTITNNGTIAFSGFEGTSDEFLSIVGEVILNGTGEVVLVEQDDSVIFGAANGLLKNNSNTIRGVGQVEVDVENSGTLLADSPTGDLVFARNVLLGSESTLAVTLDGTSFSESGSFFFGNPLKTNGKLKLAVGQNFDARIGETHQIISTSFLEGSGFSAVDQSHSQTPSRGYRFEVLYDSSSVSVVVVDSWLLGDINRDGQIDLLDISPFVELLVNDSYQPEGDVNGDGVVDLLDIGPFIDLISSS